MANLVKSAVYEEKCPACGNPNYFDGGDPDDLSLSDLEALQCWDCSEVWFLEIVDIEWEFYYPSCGSKEEALNEAIDRTIVEVGKKKI